MADNLHDDPLSKLVVDRHALDRELLAELLHPYVELHEDEPHIEFTLDGEKLKLRARMLIYLLARKALVATNLIEDEQVLPNKIEEDTGWSGGSIRPTLRSLLEQKLIRRDRSEGGGYYVANNTLTRIGEVLLGE
jgi:hypothetical protein